MPLWKFRTIEEMNAFADMQASNNAARLKALLVMMEGVAPPICRRGVQKFRTMEEADEERIAREKERAAACSERLRQADE